MKPDITYWQRPVIGEWILTGPHELDLTKRDKAIKLVTPYVTFDATLRDTPRDKRNDVSPEDYIDAFLKFWKDVPDDGLDDKCKTIVTFEHEEDWVVDANRVGLLKLFGIRLSQ